MMMPLVIVAESSSSAAPNAGLTSFSAFMKSSRVTWIEKANEVIGYISRIMRNLGCGEKYANVLGLGVLERGGVDITIESKRGRRAHQTLNLST